MANTTGLGDTIYAAVKKAINDAEGSSGGGGGGGDFTTAEVTIVNGTSSPITVMVAITVDSIEEGSHLIPLLDVNKNRTSTVLAALYKGHGIAVFTSGTLSIEGSATDLGDGAVDVAGDCTITVS